MFWNKKKDKAKDVDADPYDYLWNHATMSMVKKLKSVKEYVEPMKAIVCNDYNRWSELLPTFDRIFFRQNSYIKNYHGYMVKDKSSVICQCSDNQMYELKTPSFFSAESIDILLETYNKILADIEDTLSLSISEFTNNEMDYLTLEDAISLHKLYKGDDFYAPYIPVTTATTMNGITVTL